MQKRRPEALGPQLPLQHPQLLGQLPTVGRVDVRGEAAQQLFHMIPTQTGTLRRKRGCQWVLPPESRELPVGGGVREAVLRLSVRARPPGSAGAAAPTCSCFRRRFSASVGSSCSSTEASMALRLLSWCSRLSPELSSGDVGSSAPGSSGTLV